jgi:hypothetical protein
MDVSFFRARFETAVSLSADSRFGREGGSGVWRAVSIYY